jgi:hypothetical protein
MNYIVSGNGTITIVIDNQSFTVGYDHPNYMGIKECIVNNDTENIVELIDIPSAIEDYAEGKVTVTDGILRYDGEEIHNSLTERIMGMMRNGFAYKAVTSDYFDKWSRTIDNSVGETVSMQRRKVNDDCGVGCSDGLHCGALEYVESYRAEHAGDRVVIVKVNPKDVVSVPTDCECQKVRTCEYQVVADYEGPLKSLLHKSEDGQAWTEDEFREFMSNLMGVNAEENDDAYDGDAEDHYDGYDPSNN